MQIGIISYLPDTEFREKRKQVHCDQISWLRQLYGNNQEIYVVAQNYEENDYLDNLIYHKANKPLGGSIARNIILKRFYESDEDYLLILDDDTMIYPYYHMDIMMKEFQTVPSKYLEEIDMTVASYPAYKPFKKVIFNDPQNKFMYKFVPKPHIINMSLMFLKNLKKYYDKEIYFDEKMVLPPDFELTMEDTEFGLACIVEGMKCYQAECLIAKCPNWNTSTIYKDESKRLDKNKKSIEYIIEKYKNYGILRREYGRMDTKRFNKAFHKAKQILYIPREEPIQFSEKEIPENNNKKKYKGLF